MRKLSLLLGVIISSLQLINAQDIFKQHGFNKEPLTLSNGRFNEFFTNDEVVQLGTVLLNAKSNEIIAFIDEDTARVKYLAEFSSRWFSIDPLAAKYPQVTPYVFCGNNPILFVDPDGLDYFYYNNQGNMLERVKNDKPDAFYLRQTQQVTEFQEKTLDDGTIVKEEVLVNKTVDSQIDMNSDLGNMIRTVYAESAGESKESKLGVAEVIRNRANDKTPNSAAKGWAAIFSKVDTYEEVVKQAGQFESVQSSASRYSNPMSMLKDSKGNRNEMETTAFSESVGASINAHYQKTNTAQGAVYFYSPYISAPAWTTKLQQVTIQGVNNNAFKFYKFK
ncbi:MAG: cell wall hydrolase [Lutibacter sp.]|jgi:spore germination cell wall hydrolase CwlJ-like protein